MKFAQFVNALNTLKKSRNALHQPRYNRTFKYDFKQIVDPVVAGVNAGIRGQDEISRDFRYKQPAEISQVRPREQAALIYDLISSAKENLDRDSSNFQELLHLCQLALLEPQVKAEYDLIIGNELIIEEQDEDTTFEENLIARIKDLSPAEGGTAYSKDPQLNWVSHQDRVTRPLSALLDDYNNPKSRVQGKYWIATFLDKTSQMFGGLDPNLGGNWERYAAFAAFTGAVINTIVAAASEIPTDESETLNYVPEALIEAIEPHYYDSLSVELMQKLGALPDGVMKNVLLNSFSKFITPPNVLSTEEKIVKIGALYGKLMRTAAEFNDPSSPTATPVIELLQETMRKIETMRSAPIKAAIATHTAPGLIQHFAAFCAAQDHGGALGKKANQLANQIDLAQLSPLTHKFTQARGEKTAMEQFQNLCKEIYRSDSEPASTPFFSTKPKVAPKQKKMRAALDQLTASNPIIHQLASEAAAEVNLKALKDGLKKNIKQFYPLNQLGAESTRHNQNDCTALRDTISALRVAAGTATQELAKGCDLLIAAYKDIVYKTTTPPTDGVVAAAPQYKRFDGGYLKTLKATLHHVMPAMTPPQQTVAVATHIKLELGRYLATASHGELKTDWAKNIARRIDNILGGMESTIAAKIAQIDQNAAQQKQTSPERSTEIDGIAEKTKSEAKQAIGKRSLEKVALLLAEEESALRLHDKRFIGSRLQSLVHDALNKTLKPLLSPQYVKYIDGLGDVGKRAKKAGEKPGQDLYEARGLTAPVRFQ